MWGEYRCRMEVDAYLTSIRKDADAMVAAARTVGLDARVPTCPDWSVEDLTVHTSRVHRHKTETVLGEYRDGPAPFPDGPVGGDTLVWFEIGVDEMLDIFESSDLTKPSWTWCEHDHTADWWVRRMAHETTIHSADALIAAGQVPHIDPDLALDGVDEILDEMMVGGPKWGTDTPGDRTVRLESGDRSWMLRFATFSGTSPTTGKKHNFDTLVYDDSAEPDATIRTDPATLDLWLWGRGDLPASAFEGDGRVVDDLRTLAAVATQ